MQIVKDEPQDDNGEELVDDEEIVEDDVDENEGE